MMTDKLPNNDINLTLPHAFRARAYQDNLVNAIADGVKRACCVWHRRSGKDKTALNLMIKESAKRAGIYYYFFPTYNQGRKILWDGIDKDGFPFRGHIPPPAIDQENATEMKILTKWGALIQVIGSDNIDSIVGTNPIGCVFTEYSLQNPLAWEYIRPILAENGGWAIFLFTPRGKNHAYDLYKMAKANKGWFCEVLTVNDTNAISLEAIDLERESGMSEELIQQEFYCSFEASNPGAYYGKEMTLARNQGRITQVPVESGIPVNTFWDIGIDDSMAIWLQQDVGREIRLVGYIEDNNEGFPYFVRKLNEWIAGKNAVWGYWVLPHDGANRSPQTGKSSKDFIRGLGFENIRVAPRPYRKEDGIEAVRQVLGKCLFDETGCSRGLEALTQYSKEYSEINKVFKTRPISNWACHGADAFQTLALGHPRLLYMPSKVIDLEEERKEREVAEDGMDDPLRFGLPKRRKFRNN